jgi:hypothetical protein
MTESHPKTRRLGDARVGTRGRTPGTRPERLRAEGRARIDREKVSGARPDRREPLKLVKVLAHGSAVTMTLFDRLARSTFALFAMAG